MAKILTDLESATGPELSQDDYHLLAHIGHVFLLDVQAHVLMGEGKLNEVLDRANEKFEMMESITGKWTQDTFIRVLNTVEGRAGIELSRPAEEEADEDHAEPTS